MRLSIVALIVVLLAGGVVISAGFLTNQNETQVEVVPVVENPYEKLEKYKNELEKINVYNQQVLDDLHEKAKSATDDNLDQINEEIQILKHVINENHLELEDITKKLSEMESDI
ncbi:MAG: hypothetical protein ACRBB2_08950 [Nitrosopumilus sp.]